jgi:hypothetical protein
MKHRLLSLRDVSRPLFCVLVAWTALVAGAAMLIAPAALTAGAWPPLHARCIGVMVLSLSVAIAVARRALDPAALRMPLIALAAWSLSSAALAWAYGGALLLWPWGLAAVGIAALLFSRVDSDPPAPAQHADKGWRLFALLALAVAVPLMSWPRGVVAQWPWRLAAPLVAQYGPLFLAWGVAAWLLSRERRRYVRAPVLWGLLVWALGVLAVSLWHAAAFAWARPIVWLWFATFSAVALLAAQRLGPRALHLGRQSHDSGTRPPRQ